MILNHFLNNTKVEVAATGIVDGKKSIKDAVKSGILP